MRKEIQEHTYKIKGILHDLNKIMGLNLSSYHPFLHIQIRSAIDTLQGEVNQLKDVAEEEAANREEEEPRIQERIEAGGYVCPNCRVKINIYPGINSLLCPNCRKAYLRYYGE